MKYFLDQVLVLPVELFELGVLAFDVLLRYQENTEKLVRLVLENLWSNFFYLRTLNLTLIL